MGRGAGGGGGRRDGFCSASREVGGGGRRWVKITCRRTEKKISKDMLTGVKCPTSLV